MTVDFDFSCEDEPLGLFPRVNKTSGDEKGIESLLCHVGSDAVAMVFHRLRMCYKKNRKKGVDPGMP